MGAQASAADEDLVAARAAMEAGDAQEALRLLSFGFGKDPGYRPLYELASACLRQLGGQHEAELFDSALAQFDDPQPLYDLGYHFIEVGHNRLAIPFLERALALAPDDPQIATELAVALTGHFQPRRAYDLLASLDLDGEFWPTYQRYWCALLSNLPEGIEQFIDDCREALTLVDPTGAGEGQGVPEALDKLRECLERLRSVGQPSMQIRDWHFIQYGGAILDYFDQRTAEEALEVAGGRWVALWGSLNSLLGVLLKLKQLLEQLGRLPSLVLALPDRDSEIVGRALAGLIGRDFALASGAPLTQPDSLVVVADSRSLDEPETLRYVQPGQTLFALNLHWLGPSAVTPDVAGFMSQVYYYPWDEQFRIDQASGDYQRTPPDDRPAELIAAELLAAQPEEDPGFVETLAFYRRHQPLLTCQREGAARLPFWTDSPIPGSYFH